MTRMMVMLHCFIHSAHIECLLYDWSNGNPRYDIDYAMIMMIKSCLYVSVVALPEIVNPTAKELKIDSCSVLVMAMKIP
jgi:hypothetical protein